MNGWKVPMHLPKISLPKLDIQQRITKAVWKDDKVPEDLKLFELNSKLSTKTNVSFQEVESYITVFVEHWVPYHVDELYRLHALINEDEFSVNYSELQDLIQEMKVEILEMNKLGNHIRNEDIDDFDLRIKPAKHKIKEAVRYFLKLNNTGKLAFDSDECDTTANTIATRSPKARDLLSFLDDQEHFGGINLHFKNVEATRSADTECDAVEEDFCELQKKEIFSNVEPDNSMVEINQDLLDVLELMREFSEALTDDLLDDVAKAESDASEGNTQISKTSLLKAAIFPVAGAVLGGVVAGPIGFLAGMKVGSVTGGLAMAGITGSMAGYQGGKLLKKKRDTIEPQSTEDQKTAS